MKSRTLTLRAEALADLTIDQLSAVAGASGAPCNLTETCVPSRCGCTGYYPSLNAPCTDFIQIEGTLAC